MTSSRIVVPDDIDVTLPPAALVRQALAGAMVTLPGGTKIYRAVRHPAAVIPEYVERIYRFGPPAAYAGPDGRYSPYWMYTAHDLPTALWESGFCTNDMTQPGTFYIPPDVVAKGLIATFILQGDVTVLDLSGSVLSKLGIYDRIHGEHAWCQWFGLRMFEVLEDFGGSAAPVGFRYPSRKHKNSLALAVQSQSLDAWRREVQIEVTPFASMPEFEILRSDPNYADPFYGVFSVR